MISRFVLFLFGDLLGDAIALSFQLLDLPDNFTSAGIQFDDFVDIGRFVFIFYGFPDRIRILTDEFQIQHDSLSSFMSFHYKTLIFVKFEGKIQVLIGGVKKTLWALFTGTGVRWKVRIY